MKTLLEHLNEATSKSSLSNPYKRFIELIDEDKSRVLPASKPVYELSVQFTGIEKFMNDNASWLSKNAISNITSDFSAAFKNLPYNVKIIFGNLDFYENVVNSGILITVKNFLEKNNIKYTVSVLDYGVYFTPIRDFAPGVANELDILLSSKDYNGIAGVISSKADKEFTPRSYKNDYILLQKR